MQDDRLDLHGLRSFVVLAERLNFSEAAFLLGVSAPALTRRIQRLEAALGLPLLERSTRRVAATAEGLRFLHRAREALAVLDEAVEATRAEARQRTGRLVLASVPTMTAQLLPQVVRAFRQRRPEVHVRVLECGAGAVEQAVRDGTADLGFGFPTGPIAADLVFERVLEDPYCLLLLRSHPLAARHVVEWQELKRHKVITAGRQSGNMQVLDRLLNGVEWRPGTQYEVDHLTTALGLVEAGLGIAVMPRSALVAAKGADLVVRPLTEPGATRTLGVFRRRNAPLSAAARQLLAVARRSASSLESGEEDGLPAAGQLRSGPPG